MRFVSLLTALCALFVASLMLTATSVLTALDGPSADICIEDLESGRLFAMFTGPTLWNRYPEIPADPSAVLDHYAIAFSLGLAVVCVLLVRSRFGVSSRAVAIFSLVAGIIPYTIGAAVLRSTSHSPGESGMWVSLMIHGVFYSACISLVVSFVDRCRTNRARASYAESNGQKTSVLSAVQNLESA